MGHVEEAPWWVGRVPLALAAYCAQSGNHREAIVAEGSQGESGQGLWDSCQGQVGVSSPTEERRQAV